MLAQRSPVGTLPRLFRLRQRLVKLRAEYTRVSVRWHPELELHGSQRAYLRTGAAVAGQGYHLVCGKQDAHATLSRNPRHTSGNASAKTDSILIARS